jgi:hypothetical protein
MLKDDQAVLLLDPTDKNILSFITAISLNKLLSEI